MVRWLLLSCFCCGAASMAMAADAPRIVFAVAEDEYETATTLPKWAERRLADVTCEWVLQDPVERFRLTNCELVDTADVLVLSIRRRPLPPEQLERFRKYVRSGKPVIGIRTANHAFCLRNMPPAAGLAEWRELDAEVFGGHYTNHYGADRLPKIEPLVASQANPLLKGIDAAGWTSGGSLYQVSPLAAGTNALLRGRVEGSPEEPVAWTFTRADGGWSFYTSLGHRRDFEQPEFAQLLENAAREALRTR